MTPHVRLSLVLGAVVSVTGCVNEGIFRRHLYFPWPCTMIRPRTMRALRVVRSPRTRPNSHQGEAWRHPPNEVWRSGTQGHTQGMRYSNAPLDATKPRVAEGQAPLGVRPALTGVAVLDLAAPGDQERSPFTIPAPGRLRRGCPFV